MNPCPFAFTNMCPPRVGECACPVIPRQRRGIPGDMSCPDVLRGIPHPLGSECRDRGGLSESGGVGWVGITDNIEQTSPLAPLLQERGICWLPGWCFFWWIVRIGPDRGRGYVPSPCRGGCLLCHPEAAARDPYGHILPRCVEGDSLPFGFGMSRSGWPVRVGRGQRPASLKH